MYPKPIDFDAIVAMKELSLQRELEMLEKKLEELQLSEWQWQIEHDLYRTMRYWKVLAFEHWGQEYADPPKMRQKYPILKGTVSDWDFEFGYSGKFDLDTAIYRSSPSSLRNKYSIESKISCNYAGTTNLPTGRIESWFYKSGTSYARKWGFLCRCQYPTWANCYDANQDITDGAGTSLAYIREGGVVRKSGSISEPPCNAWFNGRLTWWESGAWLILRLERFYTGAWHNDLGDFADESPSYTSGVRRCGFYWMGHESEDMIRTDDTTIYAP